MIHKFINKMTGLERGKALFEKQEFEKAIEVLNSFLAEHENNADALYTRAICFRKIEKYDESVSDLSAILTRLPNEPTLLCDRGISHFKNKNIEAALEDMNKAVELDLNNPFRYSSRAYIRSRSDINGAMEDYEKAIALDPKDEISLNNLGLLQENAGKMKAAQNNFKKSNAVIGYDPEKRHESVSEKTVKTEISKEIEVTEKLKHSHQEGSLWKIMLRVFTSKKTRQEYFNFLKSLFKRAA